MNPDDQAGEKLRSRFAALDRLDGAPPWRDPERVRVTARRRRRMRAAFAAAAALVVAAGVFVAVRPHAAPHAAPHVAHQRSANGLIVGGHSGAGVLLVADSTPLPADSAAAAAVSRAEQQFTLQLLRSAGTGSASNVVLSPSSLAIMLAMLQNGASGTTRAEIARVLGTSTLTNRQQNAGWASLIADLAGAGGGVTLDSANSLWLQRNLPMGKSFMDALAQYYRTGVWQVDFHRDLPGATTAINTWVADSTHGKITTLFAPGDLDRSTALVLANAVYFTAAWKQRFDPRLTRDGTFATASGPAATVPFMSVAAPVGQAQSSGYVAAQLPYTGGRFAASFIMPTRTSLTSFVAGLDSASLARITKQLDLGAAEPTTVTLPKFELDHYTNLGATLQRMGMRSAFTDAADLSAMSHVPLKVQAVVQRDHLKVDEHGTEAAAVTGGAVQATALRAPIRFDHPFLMLVRDTKTGAVLFAAEIRNPAG